MNAPNIKRSIVNNARKLVTNALKNAGAWQRSNTDPHGGHMIVNLLGRPSMLRKCLSTSYMFGLLLFVMSASAYEYMGTTTIDLTTPRFSGIGTTFTPQMKLTEAFVIGRCPCGRDVVSRQVADGAGWPQGGLHLHVVTAAQGTLMRTPAIESQSINTKPFFSDGPARP
jgi:hypothetical protein